MLCFKGAQSEDQIQLEKSSNLFNFGFLLDQKDTFSIVFLVKQHFGLLYFSALKKRKTKERVRETEKINK